jgi:hypothetical protein
MEATFLTMHYSCKRCGHRWEDRVVLTDPTAEDREGHYELSICQNCAGKGVSFNTDKGKKPKK